MKQHGAKAGGMTCETAQRAIALAAVSSSEREFYRGGSPSYEQAEGESLPSSWGRDPSFESERRIGAVSGEGMPGQFLPREDQTALAEHVRCCRACQDEMVATTAFFQAFANDVGPEPSPTLLARARQQLDATLDSCEQASLWTRLSQQLAFTAGRLRAAPALSSALLFLGLLAGGYAGYQAGHAAHTDDQTALLLAPPAPEAPSVVADVSSIRQDPASGLVEVHYDRLVPDVLSAPADDPSIRELLMAATENGVDLQVRNASLSLLSGSCRLGRACSALADGGPARNALLNALASDKEPEVRREALAGLQPFIAEDMQVRDAVLAALLNDPSAPVRIEAVRLLQSVDVDSSVRQVLHTVAFRDGDPSIRSASLAALKTMPQVQ